MFFKTCLNFQLTNVLPVKRTKADFRNPVSVNPSTSNVSLSNSSLLLKVESAWKEFCFESDVNEKNFESLIASTKEKNKLNKMARIVCSAIKTIMPETDDSTVDKEFLSQIIKTIRDEELLYKVIFFF